MYQHHLYVASLAFAKAVGLIELWAKSIGNSFCYRQQLFQLEDTSALSGQF